MTPCMQHSARVSTLISTYIVLTDGAALQLQIARFASTLRIASELELRQPWSKPRIRGRRLTLRRALSVHGEQAHDSATLSYKTHELQPHERLHMNGCPLDAAMVWATAVSAIYLLRIDSAYLGWRLNFRDQLLSPLFE